LHTVYSRLCPSNKTVPIAAAAGAIVMGKTARATEDAATECHVACA